MKFGKFILSQQETNQHLHYVEYKVLKNRIYDVLGRLKESELGEALTANTGFEEELAAEIGRVNACFEQRQKELHQRAGDLADKVRQEDCAKDASSSSAAEYSSGVASTGQALLQRRPEAFGELVELLKQVDQLRKYAVWNAVAVVKILKKRRKQTNFGLEDAAAEKAGWLSRQGFFSGSEFAELHAVVESLGHLLVLSELKPEGAAPLLQPDPCLDQKPQQCPICLDTISDMIELSCSHRFCWKCFVLKPIAFQPGEYRISQCPICRKETIGSSAGPCGVGDASAEGSDGVLTRFLHTYCGGGSAGAALRAVEEAEKDVEAQEEQNESCEKEEPKFFFDDDTPAQPEEDVSSQRVEDRDMRDVVGELVKALYPHGALKGAQSSQVSSGAAGADGLHCSDAAASSSLAQGTAPSDFFQTLPHKPSHAQAQGTAQKLQWLQLASTGDPLALDQSMYCSLCAEPLLMEAVVTTPCKHYFHSVCIKRISLPQCPLCAEPLPFSWFLPRDHPCAERGFRCVPVESYKPLFLGGPSRGSGGFPLHQPPPTQLYAPGGLTMKAYLHRVVPTGPEAGLGAGAGTEQDFAVEEEDDALEASKERDEDAQETEVPRGSSISDSEEESSSEGSGSEDSEEHHRTARRAVGRRTRYKLAFSAVGSMRMCESRGIGAAKPTERRSAKEATGEIPITIAHSSTAGPARASGAAPTGQWRPQHQQPHKQPQLLLIGDHV